MKNNQPDMKTNAAPVREAAGNPFADAPVIFSYTRAQAIEDGVLVDLTEWAKETGFRIPVACTAAIWDQYLVPPEGTRGLGQSERGRAHDLLWMLYTTIRAFKRKGEVDDRLLYKVIFLQAPHRQETVALKAICGPDDHGEPVMTIMCPDEDWQKRPFFRSFLLLSLLFRGRFSGRDSSMG